jgi:hypothetical protein
MLIKLLLRTATRGEVSWFAGLAPVALLASVNITLAPLASVRVGCS